MNYFKIFSLSNGESEVEELKFNLSTEDFIKGTPSFPMEDLGNTNTLKIACVPRKGNKSCEWGSSSFNRY